MAEELIEIYGAREHNLKNIDLKIPRNKLVVFTGVSGSGKSSLAFDTICAEGQRRYIETFSAYARQFLGNLERPDVDKIEGLSPVISIEQKTTSRNPRSTVGTITEIYDFLRLLYARVSEAYSFETGEKMIQYTNQQIEESIYEEYNNKKIILLSPLVKARKGNYKELFLNYFKRGFLEARIDGELKEIQPDIKLDRYKVHDIELVVDKFKITQDNKNERFYKSIQTALNIGKGTIIILDIDGNSSRFYSKNLMCPTTGISYDSPEPNAFSFNSPKGYCPTCSGMGHTREVDLYLLFDEDKTLSFDNGGFKLFEETKVDPYLKKQIQRIFDLNNLKISTPIKKISKEIMDQILYGVDDSKKLDLKYAAVSKTVKVNFEGIINYIETLLLDKTNPRTKWIEQKYTQLILCKSCQGKRLKQESLQFFIDNKNIHDATEMDLQSFFDWIQQLEKKLDGKQKTISREIIKEIETRTKFLLEVGLDYLSLARQTNSLSGGEAQRIRLATQIGSQLVNVLYILDEPSIGLHQRDNHKLIKALKDLRDLGNSIIVVEHDKDIMLASDYLVDIGPFAGEKGGEIIWEGHPDELKNAKTTTANYLLGKSKIALPETRRKGNGNFLELKGAKGNNLKNVSLKIPLGTLVCVTGVSGSGKSSLINETLYPILNKHIYNGKTEPLPYKEIKGLEEIDKIINVDQAPIGRMARSNTATYTGMFTEIRNLFKELPEAKIRGYDAGRFSFNVKSGRCNTCEGSGLRTIEMNFLPDIYVNCETCNGKRYNRETLEIRFKGKSISDILDMTADDLVDFFSVIPKISDKAKALKEVGLGYLKIGQSATTLSGGEAQRIKLATELSKRQTGKTLYILDEPTTGLHFDDINILMQSIEKIVDYGNTVIIIEHNFDVIKLADYIFDVGPEGGAKGGKIIAEGTPEQIAKLKNNSTAQFLKEEL
jgi:excinuclease ABC subunit A